MQANYEWHQGAWPVHALWVLKRQIIEDIDPLRGQVITMSMSIIKVNVRPPVTGVVCTILKVGIRELGIVSIALALIIQSTKRGSGRTLRKCKWTGL